MDLCLNAVQEILSKTFGVTLSQNHDMEFKKITMKSIFLSLYLCFLQLKIIEEMAAINIKLACGFYTDHN